MLSNKNIICYTNKTEKNLCKCVYKYILTWKIFTKNMCAKFFIIKKLQGILLKLVIFRTTLKLDA